jgi:hypothetical protein
LLYSGGRGKLLEKCRKDNDVAEGILSADLLKAKGEGFTAHRIHQRRFPVKLNGFA